MAAFTSPTNADWTALTFIRDEIERAVNERMNAAFDMDLPTTTIAVGDDVQDHSVFSQLQANVDLMLVYPFIEAWLDHEANGGDYSGASGPVRMTWERFIEISGLHDSDGVVGWRRTTVHPDDPAFTAFEYGAMQAGDIIGPWIFEDLQKACCALKWTATTVSTEDSDKWYAFEQSVVGMAEAKAAAISAWGSAGQPCVGVWLSYTYSDEGMYGAELDGGTIDASVSLAPSLDYEYDAYIYTQAPSGGSYTGLYGFVEDEYVRFAEGVDKGDTFQIGDTTAPPWPSSDPGRTGCVISATSGLGVAVVKWAFSNGELPA